MKIKLLCIAFSGFSFFASAQMALIQNETPEQLIMNTFAGENVTISNVKFNLSTVAAGGMNQQFARFYNGMAGIGMEDGLILSTGIADGALGPNTSGSMTTSALPQHLGDYDLHMAINAAFTVQSAGVVEFDFVPTGNTVLFEYVFTSEEYPEWVNSSFNDVFGLFLSGPDTQGPYWENGINIAEIPGANMAVSINNLNNGTQNQGPCENCQYYLSNGIGQTPDLNTQFQYDGHTTVLTASGPVVPGELHHIRIAVGNVSDNALDSAIFLKSGSFRSATLLSNAEANVQSVKMYPNPASQFIRISAALNINRATIADMTGRTIRDVVVSASDTEIDLSGLSKGHYLVTFSLSDGARETQKLVVR